MTSCLSITAVPSEPLNVQVTHAPPTDNSAAAVRVSWSRPLRTNGVIIAYHVLYTTTPTDDAWTSKRQHGKRQHGSVNTV